MIRYKKKPNTVKQVEGLLHPIVKKWFYSRFEKFSLPQLFCLTEVHSRNNILLSAPTGATKTLSSFCSILNELVDSSEKGILQDKIYAVYISPLKALNSDIHVNLINPLQEMEKIAGKELGIRVAVRTGDTTAYEKQKMLKNPPHILITTPESLSILLSSKKFVEHLKQVEWMIVDEIHSIAENKRGVHLSLSMERLQRLSLGMCRVGLSACLDKNECITLSNGKIVKIGELVEKRFKQNEVKKHMDMEYVSVDDIKVLSVNKEGKIIPNSVSKVWRIPYKNNLVEVILDTGKKIRITNNDKFLSLKEGKLIWKKVSECRTGEFIAIPKQINVKGNSLSFLQYISGCEDVYTPLPYLFVREAIHSEVKKRNITFKELAQELGVKYNKLINLKEGHTKVISLPLLYTISQFLDKPLPPITKLCGKTGKHNIEIREFLDKKFMRLFGLIASDGHVSHGITNFFNKNPVLLEEVKHLFFHCFGKYPSEREHSLKKKDNFILSFKSIPVSYIFKELGLNFGKKSHTKEIHLDIPSLPVEMISSFISGYLDGDGCVNISEKKGKRAYFRVHSSSQAFINQMYYCFVRLGVHPFIIKSERENGPLYYLQVTSARDRKILSNLLPNKGKSAKIKEYIEEEKRTVFLPIGDLIQSYKEKKQVFYRDLDKRLGVYSYDIVKRGYCSESLFNKIITTLSHEDPESKLLQELKKIRDMDLIFEKIKQIEKVKEEVRYVYDLSVEKNKNFIASNIIVHNTVAPLDKVAQYLVGAKRDCKIIDVQYLKDTNLEVISPVEDLVNTDYDTITRETYNLLDKLIQEHKTTLVFTNTRAATERIVHHLKQKFPRKYYERTEDGEEDAALIGAHHGSLSKEHRMKLENDLRDGKMRAVVCSTSLELGLDIGFIDLVVCIGSPKSAARFLQRAGRAGHKLHETVKAKLLVNERDDLVECSVLLKHAVEKIIDKIHIPCNSLDVLAQQLLGMVIEEVWDVDDLFKVVRDSYCYRDLKRADFNEILDYLAGNFISLEDRYIYARIWWDKEENKVGKKGKMTRVIYMTNSGTIPDQQGILVKDRGGNRVGKLDEGFLEKLNRGDIFVLGGNTYQFNYARGMVAQVTPMPGRRPTVPSWYSQRLPLSYDLAKGIQHFRFLMEEKFRKKKSKKEILAFVNKYLYVDEIAAEALYNYFYNQYEYIGVPHEKKLIIENYRDESMKNYVVFHTLYGRRVNDALSRALAYAIGRSQHKDVEIGINDNGFYISYDRNVNVMKAFKLIKSKEFRKVVENSIDKSEILKRRFRHCAGRALMILRNYKGRRKRVGRQQVSSMILLSAVRRISENFFIIRETRREILEDLMDIESAEEVFKDIESKKIKVEEVMTFVPSPFALNLVMQGYSDILRMEDKQKFLQRMHYMVQAKIALKQGRRKS